MVWRIRLLPPSTLSVVCCSRPNLTEREFFIVNLLVRIHFIIEMIRWTGLAPWEFEFPFSGSLASTFLILLLLAQLVRLHHQPERAES